MTEHIHPFVPTEAKLNALVDKLKSEYLWLSDEFRDEETVCGILTRYLGAEDCKVYEWGDGEAIFLFGSIIPGWKATFSFKLVNPSVWSPSFVRECKGFLRGFMTENGLFRLETSTPDARVVKMARMVGFDSEGTRFKGFRWGGTYYDETLLCLMED